MESVSGVPGVREDWENAFLNRGLSSVRGESELNSVFPAVCKIRRSNQAHGSLAKARMGTDPFSSGSLGHSPLGLSGPELASPCVLGHSSLHAPCPQPPGLQLGQPGPRGSPKRSPHPHCTSSQALEGPPSQSPCQEFRTIDSLNWLLIGDQRGGKKKGKAKPNMLCSFPQVWAPKPHSSPMRPWTPGAHPPRERRGGGGRQPKPFKPKPPSQDSTCPCSLLAMTRRA